MWNGFSMISKRPELTEGMMQTLVEAERTLLESPGIAACHTTSLEFWFGEKLVTFTQLRLLW